MNRFCALLAIILTLWTSSLLAHETTRSYITINRNDDEVLATLRVAFRDIEVVVWMDEDLDGSVTWGEAEARLPAVSSYLLSVLGFSAGGDCELRQSDTRVSETGGIAYLDIDFRGICPSATAPLQVDSSLFADVDPDHRTYLTVNTSSMQDTAILSARNPSFLADAQASSFAGIFIGYFTAGAAHLAGGFDHVAFLLMLMLPAVTVQPDKRTALVQVIAAVTGFTLAHALTLTAASTYLLRPPTDLIAVLVAVTIIVTAIDNIRPFLPGPRAAVAAFFGLIHGFGFATVLSGSAMAGSVFITALLGFNLGIEAAQIGLVALIVFALMALNGGKVLLWLGSLAGALGGIYWALVASKLI